MDKYIQAIQSGLMTINEARALEDLPLIVGANAFTNSIYQMNKKLSALKLTDEIGLEISGRITCSYCSRPNHHDNDLCESCGAPLPI